MTTSGTTAKRLAANAYARRAAAVSAIVGGGRDVVRTHTLTTMSTTPLTAPTATIFCSALTRSPPRDSAPKAGESLAHVLPDLDEITVRIAKVDRPYLAESAAPRDGPGFDLHADHAQMREHLVERDRGDHAEIAGAERRRAG